MPLQIIPQQNQPVGLQLLGDTLMGGATDYLNEKRKTDDEARIRAERLADVGSARNFEVQQQDKMRALQLQDEQRKRGESFDDAKKRAEFERRLAMLSEAERRGLFDGRQIGNAVAEEAALTALQTQLSKEATFAQEQPINAQARLQELGKAEQDVSQKMAAVEARLSAQPTIDQGAVANSALMLATQANGGKQPNREQIQAALPDAMAKAQQEAQIRWYQDKQDASVQYQLLSSQLNTIRQQQANITSTFHVAPTASPLATPPPMPTASAPAPRGDPMAGFTDEINKRLAAQSAGQGAGTAGARSSLQDIQNITAARATAPAELRPMLDQSKTAMLADAYVPFDQAVLGADAKLTDVNKKIALLQQGLNPMQGVNQSPLAVPPETQGQWMADLLRQRAAFEGELAKSKQDRTAGKASLLQINTPAASQPITFPSPGALQSQPWLAD